MEERDKRFELIRIAVGLADYEVIDLQIKRLRNFSTDPRLHEILRELEQKNFRQALFLMKEYVSTPEDDFFTSSPKEEVPLKATKQPESTVMGLFDLESQVEEEERILGLDDMLKMTRESAIPPREYASESLSAASVVSEEADEEVSEEVPEEADPLFSLDQAADTQEKDAGKPASMTEAFPPGTASEIPLTETDLFEAESSSVASEEGVEQELFAFGDEDDTMSEMPDRDISTSPKDLPPVIDDDTVDYLKEEETETVPTETEPREGQKDDSKVAEEEEETFPEASPADAFSAPSDAREGERHYAAFAYMGQKYRNMLHQYPQIEVFEEGVSPEVQRFIDMVSTEDYSESQVEAAIARYLELQDQGKRAEAAQMLIAAATTESTFAQFMLARELFKGKVLEQNHPEAFTQINHLAEQDYPEAICDLGQLYEYGIGIDKNKRHALLLYEEAAEMGVERARRHYERLHGTHPVKTLTSLFRRKK